MLLSMHVRRVAPGKLRYLPWEDCEKEIGRAAEATKIADTIDHGFIAGGSAILNVSLTLSWHVACDPFWFGYIMIHMRLFTHTWWFPSETRGAFRRNLMKLLKFEACYHGQPRTFLPSLDHDYLEFLHQQLCDTWWIMRGPGMWVQNCCKWQLLLTCFSFGGDKVEWIAFIIK